MKTKSKRLQTLKMMIMGIIILFTAGVVNAEQSEITKAEILKAQKAWGNALVNIGKTCTDGRDYQKAAETLVDDLYAYQTGQVLFKPTKASDIKFRTTK